MSNEEVLTVSQQQEGDEQREDLQVQLAAKLEGALEPEAILELAAPYGHWEIWAFGPFQPFSPIPHRIIQVNEWALIHTVVWLNTAGSFPTPCDTITGFGGKIELNYFTSDTQRMQPVPALSHTHCIQTQLNVCTYHHYWWFRPTQAACIYETNICARVCNCDYHPVPQYAGFVRWVRDYDVDYLFPPRPWAFDRPIRFMVSDMSDCACPNLR